MKIMLASAQVDDATLIDGHGGRGDDRAGRRRPARGTMGTPDAAAARLLNQAAVVAEAEPGIHPRAHQYVRVDTVSRQVEFPENNAELRAPGYVRVHDQWRERADGRGYNLLRLAAELPGARVIPHASNSLGRSGKAVEFTSRNDPFDESRTSQLIFDARSLRYPGSDTVLTKARSGLPAGTVIDATSVVKISVAGKLPRVRRGTVRPSC
ncbi:hypothetical protein [Actinoallomurus acaciae]|uniref:Uncharacterized protein n=1 Tax=Actinoallomurus acaciae TaxID=502577 RepID=A0ABV5Y8Z0_9ACTN